MEKTQVFSESYFFAL